MLGSKKVKALLIAGALAALTAIPAFADQRLQGVWLYSGPQHAALLINGSNFVWVWVDGQTFIGSFTVSGGRAIFNVTQVHNVYTDLWHNHNETWTYNFSFQANNRLVINNWLYLRS